MRSRRPLFIALYFAYLSACVAVTAIAVQWVRGRQREHGHFEQTAPARPDDVVWSHDPQYVVDDRLGWRPRPNFQLHHAFRSIDGTIVRELSRKHNNMGFLDDEDWSNPPPRRPRVLLVGDSHMMGIVSNRENAGALLQAALAPAFTDGSPVVVNASSGYYSLYQYYLRARDLVEVIRPRALVVVVYLGNDFHDLEDVGRPHLDDELRARAATARLFTDRTVKRLDLLGLPMDLNNQGTNQASYFAEMPERRDKALDKARRTVELLAGLADDHEFEPLWVLLPSYDMIFPEVVRRMSGRAAALVDQRVNERLHADFSRILEAHAQTSVDLLPVFRANRSATLYAADYHIWQEGHRLLADAVVPVVKTSLLRQGQGIRP